MGYGHAMPHVPEPDCPCDPKIEYTKTEDGRDAVVIAHQNYYPEGNTEPVEPLVHTKILSSLV